VKPRRSIRRSAFAALLAAAPLAAGCNAISGLSDLHVVEGGAGGTSAAGGSGTTSGAGGATTTTTTHAGGGTTSSHAGGHGGAGGAAACTTDAECPTSPEGCALPRCQAGVCGETPLPKDTPTVDQTHGDCQERVCDGAGKATSKADDTDVPASTACDDASCSGGVVAHAPKAAGSACNEGGGTKCDGKGACAQCLAPADCKSGVCSAGQCVDASCADGVKNGTETDVDCGGDKCAGCADGKACVSGPDCASLVCDGDTSTCSPPACSDGVKNGTESDVDCGGDCAPCVSGQACGKHADCATEACLGGTCAGIAHVAAGSAHACAVLDSGAVHCWGANAAGQLGDGTTKAHASPAPVTLPAKATSVALGDPASSDPTLAHACAVLEGGAVACWGANDHGQAGIGKLSPSEPKPAAIPNLANVTVLVAGGRHTCAVTGGSLYCWGDNLRGQLGLGSHTTKTEPALVPLNGGFPMAKPDHVAAGDAHTCIAGGFAPVACTGANSSGQLGVGDTNDRASFTATNSNVLSNVAAGASFSFGFTGAGGKNAQAWGDNTTGELGTGQSPGSHASPNGVNGLSTALVVSGGSTPNQLLAGHACAALASGGASCWGDNTSGQLGTGLPLGQNPLPQAVPGLKNVLEIAAGGAFTCALIKKGPLRCWGKNDMGQLGRGVASLQPAPTPGAVVWP
jgi:alpha-tubulin suppressor-like RCC1 family protein